MLLRWLVFLLSHLFLLCHRMYYKCKLAEWNEIFGSPHAFWIYGNSLCFFTCFLVPLSRYCYYRSSCEYVIGRWYIRGTLVLFGKVKVKFIQEWNLAIYNDFGTSLVFSTIHEVRLPCLGHTLVPLHGWLVPGRLKLFWVWQQHFCFHQPVVIFRKTSRASKGLGDFSFVRRVFLKEET